MGSPTGFLEHPRQGPRARPIPVRVRDWHEVYEPQSDEEVSTQASRCMDCGIPFCTQGCPLGNRIPVFNDGAYRADWARAAEQLFATNNFPEFTGRLCPAPCESACVLGIGDDPVTIERVEYEVAEHAFARGLPVATTPRAETGRRVVVVGSGPAGLAAAAQLRAAGHAVEVLERADAPGGLLRYGIPEFKLEKRVLERRLEVMRAAGIVFTCGVEVGARGPSLAAVAHGADAVVLALGSTRPRLIEVPGSELAGVETAMAYLETAGRALAGGAPSPLDAAGRHVVILGGGDTGADCLGTAHRQGAASVTQVEIMDRPPDERPADQPWPTMPRIFKTTSAHAEGGERRFSTETLAFLGEGRVHALRARDHLTGEVFEMPADLVVIAAGFVGPELDGLGLAAPELTTERATLRVGDDWRVPVAGTTPVFACGDAVRGQSLIVWAIAEGRSAAAAVDRHLRGAATSLAAPVEPYAASW
ncbi:MAG TPA: glutamate synthase subunit beta [Acidimicrobiales bacterium]|nr:MAG: glutamate synthase [Actinobacteria bacterium 21-73-9]HQU26848.1 glutamate synthase subunit beta [Acidimicrobiales bacterium]